ncbi:trehalose-6-phosphate synthase (plasmid) [Bradyrhizobium sp. 62B]|nr:trehalose-6-phosphate synthase [Bradyrhizobium sp. 62B]
MPKTGGLAAALEPIVERSGALWLGSSGNLVDGPEHVADLERHGEGFVARVDLPETHYAGFYQGFANSMLWPAFHSLGEWMSPTTEADYQSYCQINVSMANVISQLEKRDAIWVHDYHFLPLGNELRRLNVEQPIGFFLHTPWPEPAIMERVPHANELMDMMLAYDLVGFQTSRDLDNFLACLREHLGLHSKSGAVISDRGLTRCLKFPIGIDHKLFAKYAIDALTEYKDNIVSTKQKLEGAKLAVGVDRLDYTKGIDNRIRAFDHLLTDKPRSISLLQIATPSRSNVPMYSKYQHDVDCAVDEVNRKHGGDDGWNPIHYQKDHLPQAQLAAFYRTADVAAITPLRDGMNLVAKEYVAAQDPDDPGVLVLSKFAGAAEDFSNEALLVDPASPKSISDAVLRASEMPAAERRERWTAMMNKLESYTIHDWAGDFIRELSISRQTIPADLFQHLGFGWLNEAQMPLGNTLRELYGAVKNVLDEYWVLPSTDGGAQSGDPAE